MQGSWKWESADFHWCLLVYSHVFFDRGQSWLLSWTSGNGCRIGKVVGAVGNLSSKKRSLNDVMDRYILVTLYRTHFFLEQCNGLLWVGTCILTSAITYLECEPLYDIITKYEFSLLSCHACPELGRRPQSHVSFLEIAQALHSKS